jgi:hypothetical protein
MSGKNDREQWEVLPKEVESDEPSTQVSVQGDSLAQDRRPGPPGASPEEEARHESSPTPRPGFLVSIEPAPLPEDWPVRRAEARTLVVRFLARQASAARNSMPLRKAA